jgi:hypothetical protein
MDFEIDSRIGKQFSASRRSRSQNESRRGHGLMILSRQRRCILSRAAQRLISVDNADSDGEFGAATELWRQPARG